MGDLTRFDYSTLAILVGLLVVVVFLFGALEMSHTQMGSAGCTLYIEYHGNGLLDEGNQTLSSSDIRQSTAFIEHNVESAIYHCPNGKKYSHFGNVTEHPTYDDGGWITVIGP